MQAEVFSVAWHLATKAIVGLVLTGLGALLMYPYKAIKREWAKLNARIDEAQAELVHQRTNCLFTLQDQGTRQIELLSKCASTLEAIHLSQAEMSGYIKASKE